MAEVRMAEVLPLLERSGSVLIVVLFLALAGAVTLVMTATSSRR